jgi:hypothetical protein
MPLFLNESPARRHFKDVLGQANHLLVTILVGLVAVERGLISKEPADLHAAWNPVDAVASANRSRVMALEMALVRATDALDVYIRLSRRKPALIADISLQQRIDAAGRSVLRKFGSIREVFLRNFPDSVTAALIEVMIVWRNRQVHSDEDNQVSPASWATLRANAKWIKNEFRGMEVERLFSDFTKDGPPKFKEIASFIRATHEAVRIIDSQLLESLDSQEFAKNLIWMRAGTASAGTDVKVSRQKVIQSIWGRDSTDKTQRVISFLKNCGLPDMPVDGRAAKFSDQMISEISKMAPKQLMAWIRPADAEG